MSFLNPVSEPVLRFSSTDVGAPQINYAARTAGDVKAVLKACLVTGYGAKASAGWTIINETATVAEFVSPSVAMSDYRLGIDDTSASYTTWYYQYQDARVNPLSSTMTRDIDYFDKTNADTGWELLVTNRGICFIDKLYKTQVSDCVARICYFGQVKSAILDVNSKNIAHWIVGFAAPESYPNDFLSKSETNDNWHYRVGDFNGARFSSSNIHAVGQPNNANKSAISISSPLYLFYSGDFLGEQPAFLIKSTNESDRFFGVFDTTVGARPAMQVCAAVYADQSVSTMVTRGRVFVIYTDYWEY